METVDRLLGNLCERIQECEQRAPLSFKDFMAHAAARPNSVFRNIFQVFHDMVYRYVGDGVDEYPEDPESIHYVFYDCSNLFEEGTDHPFFADRLFANRLVHHIASFRRGAQQNRIYIFEGPHGCGKSTFLNNLLLKFEQYTRTEEGTCFEALWRLDKKALGAVPEREAHAILAQLRSLVDGSIGVPETPESREPLPAMANKDYLEVPCPSHDHPVLLIPKAYRRELLDEMISDREFKAQLFSEKQYDWVFHDSSCTICTSLYQTLLDRLNSPSKIFSMIFARAYQFNRRLGQGISVFNPGDAMTKAKVLTNPLLQNQLNGLLRDSNRVKYIYSRYANTNNGIHALMDIKANNKERFANLHGIISEGVHKVEDIEENVNSLFLALMNPEDHENMADAQSFSDRITTIKIPYVLDYNTEVKIYENIFGQEIETRFLPRVLQNFARVILSSRMKTRSEALEEWIGDPDRYNLYCDRNLQLLKMDIYAGMIPTWLTEEDRKTFTARRRRRIIAESENEGNKGFSGRDSIKIFNEFYSTYAKKGKLITMRMVCSFFNKHRDGLLDSIPAGFLVSLVGLYNYTVLQEVKESLYYYNEERISHEIQNYLFAINFDPGRTEKCVYTGEELDISEGFFEAIEQRLLGAQVSEAQRRGFRRDVQTQYASRTLTQEMMLGGKTITETDIYQSLHKRYVHNLKENVLDPFLQNTNFRSAIKDYGTDSFRAYDKRIREDVTLLMQNLNKKYGYTEQGAKEVCIYVIDSDLAPAFSGR
ncbi:MAG: serine protein kinase PrkA [Syntrophobacteraceae bacterium]